MSLESMMWVEKYRPSKLEDLVDQETIKRRLKLMLHKEGQLPHLLFAGPPGSGKTTTAIIMAQHILGEGWRDYTLSLNASDERGIDMVRNRVKVFARYSDRREGIPFRIVILDECDEMCLNPESRVIVGKLDDLREMTLRELYAEYGEKGFDLPSFGLGGMRLENDIGRIIPSGKAQLYRIEFEDGRSVDASAEHPFFVINGRESKMVRTRDLAPGVELAHVSDRILRCYNCSKPFYRQTPWMGYSRHFCTTSCRNVFFGSLSVNRTPAERQEIRRRAAAAMEASGVFQSQAYRYKRAEIARRLIAQGRIPDPRNWPRFSKGEGAWVGKKLSRKHKDAISREDKRFFEENPEVHERAARKTRLALLDPTGPYQRLVASGFFKKSASKRAQASLASWKTRGFRSQIELKMAELLSQWGVPFTRERIIASNSKGNNYPFAIDLLVGNVAIFVNGCWWHVCPTCGTSAKYEKQRRNMQKDERHYRLLEKLGYKVVVIWEHELADSRSIQEEVLPRIYHAVGISGGHLPKVAHTRVKRIESSGVFPVLNISMKRNQNFVLANGILTHNTRDSQTALRRIMEEYSNNTRFILVCNYSSGIIEPLQSRCAIFRFQRLDEASVTEHLKSIAKREKVEVGSEAAYGAIYEATQGDLRQAINLLQTASASGELTTESVKSVTGATVKSRVAEVIKLAIGGDFEAARTKMVELTRVYGVPERDFLRFANEALGSMKVDDMGKAVSVLAEYDFRLVEGAQPELQLTAMLAQLSTINRKGG